MSWGLVYGFGLVVALFVLIGESYFEVYLAKVLFWPIFFAFFLWRGFWRAIRRDMEGW